MDVLSIVIAAVGSGLLATIITIAVQKYSETKRIKLDILEVLMSHRYMISDKDNVEALNKVEVVFHNNKDVRSAWEDFLNAADRSAENPALIGTTVDKYNKLLENISNCVGYKNIDWENIKRFYYPQGLANKIAEEELLRKSQLLQASAESKQDTSSGQMTAEQFGMQFMMKALETPDGLEKVAKIAEIANKSGKTGKR